MGPKPNADLLRDFIYGFMFTCHLTTTSNSIPYRTIIIPDKNTTLIKNKRPLNQMEMEMGMGPRQVTINDTVWTLNRRSKVIAFPLSL